MGAIVTLSSLFLPSGELIAHALHILQIINMQPHQSQKEERLEPQALSTSQVEARRLNTMANGLRNSSACQKKVGTATATLWEIQNAILQRNRLRPHSGAEAFAHCWIQTLHFYRVLTPNGEHRIRGVEHWSAVAVGDVLFVRDSDVKPLPAQHC